MIKYIKASLIITLLGAIAACTPKAGEKAKEAAPLNPGTATIPTTNPEIKTGTAPTIPMPTGDVRAAAPKAGNAPTIQIGKADTFSLANGLKVIVVENRKLPRVSMRVFVDYKPIKEKDAAGYVDMAGDMLLKGTTKRNKAQIDQETDFIGASINSDANGISVSGLSKYSDKMFELMSDALLNPSFPQEEFDKLMKRSESTLAQQKNSADAIAGNIGSRLRYGVSHPYGEFMNEQTLKNIKLEQVKAHYNTYFKPNISYLVITGDMSKAKAESMAKKYLSKWAKGEVAANAYPMPRPPEKTQVTFVDKPGAVQSVIQISYPVELTPGTDENIRARLLGTILGGYFNSRVNANLREGHGWTYGARAGLRADELVGSFSAGASVRNAVTDSAVVEFLKEIQRLRDEKVSKEELQVVKNVLTGQFSRNLEEPGTVAEFALTTARLKLSPNYFEQYLAKLQAVTPEEIMQAAKRYLRPDRAHILVVGNRAEVAERLKPLSANSTINFLDVNGQPVKNINTNIPAGVTGATIVADFLTAVGKDSLAKINDLQITMTAAAKTNKFGMNKKQKKGGKLSQEFLVQERSMGKTVYNSGKGFQIGHDGTKRDITGEELNILAEEAVWFKEELFSGPGYQLKVQGIDEIDGKAAYIVEVIHPDERVSTHYYDINTHLKLREISTMKAPDGAQAYLTTNYDDYQVVKGVKFPHSVVSSGAGPTLNMKVSDIKVNAGIEDSNFN
jgi:zinc protease